MAYNCIVYYKDWVKKPKIKVVKECFDNFQNSMNRLACSN